MTSMESRIFRRFIAALGALAAVFFLFLLTAQVEAAHVNFVDHAAVGDDEHDDTEAFNKAIRAALNGSRRLYVPAGRYLVSGVDLPPHNFEISGEGSFTEGGTIVVLTKPGSAVFQYKGTKQVHTLTIRDMTIDGNGAGDGVRIDPSFDISPFHVFLRDVRLVNSVYGVYMPRAFASEFSRVVIDSCSKSGLAGLRGPSNVISSADLQRIPAGSSGIHIYGNNTLITSLNSSYLGEGPALVVGRSKETDGEGTIAWVSVQSSHFEDFKVPAIEVRAGSTLSLRDTEFLAPVSGEVDSFVRFDYLDRTSYFNNVFFHSKGASVRTDVSVRHSGEEGSVLSVPGMSGKVRLDSKKPHILKLVP